MHKCVIVVVEPKMDQMGPNVEKNIIKVEDFYAKYRVFIIFKFMYQL